MQRATFCRRWQRRGWQGRCWARGTWRRRRRLHKRKRNATISKTCWRKRVHARSKLSRAPVAAVAGLEASDSEEEALAAAGWAAAAAAFYKRNVRVRQNATSKHKQLRRHRRRWRRRWRRRARWGRQRRLRRGRRRRLQHKQGAQKCQSMCEPTRNRLPPRRMACGRDTRSRVLRPRAGACFGPESRDGIDVTRRHGVKLRKAHRQGWRRAGRRRTWRRRGWRRRGRRRRRLRADGMAAGVSET